MLRDVTTISCIAHHARGYDSSGNKHFCPIDIVKAPIDITGTLGAAQQTKGNPPIPQHGQHGKPSNVHDKPRNAPRRPSSVVDRPNNEHSVPREPGCPSNPPKSIGIFIPPFFYKVACIDNSFECLPFRATKRASSMIAYNGFGISEVFAEGKNLGERIRTRYTMLYAPDRDKPCIVRRRVAGDGQIFFLSSSPHIDTINLFFCFLRLRYHTTF
mgnify:CR=1 FL=1